MQEKKKSSIFLKILLIAIAIFIGLAFYAYKMIKDDKENSSYKNAEVLVINTPIPHPPLTQRDKKDEPSKDEEKKHSESNKTKNIPEGAEYISPEEQREREENLSLDSQEDFFEEQVIPQTEINDYEDAITIPVIENEIESSTTSTNPFNNISLGTPIGTQNNQSNQEHPTLGTPIGDTELSPF